MYDRQTALDNICTDLEAMCKSAVDSILNPEIAPSREFAMPIMSNWAAGMSVISGHMQGGRAR